MKLRFLSTRAALLGVVALVGTATTPHDAFAFGTVIPGGGNALPGGTTSVSGNSSTSVALLLDANRSYACTVKADTSTHLLGISTTVFDQDANELSEMENNIALIGAVTPGSQGSTNMMNVADNRITITPTMSGFHRFMVMNDSGSSDEAAFECMETSLYGGYNTNANPFNFLELTNISNTTISGQVRGFNFDGTATVDTGFAIAANSRFDIDVHSPAGPGVYGVLVVTHNGPLGALQGVVSQYNGPVSSVTLQAAVPMRVREQTF